MRKSFVKIEDFSFFICGVKDKQNKSPCLLLGLFALFVLSTPHANADPERTFSDQNNYKTKNRSNMRISTLGGVLRTREAVKETEENILEPTDAMIDKLLDCHYYKNRYAEGKIL